MPDAGNAMAAHADARRVPALAASRTVGSTGATPCERLSQDAGPAGPARSHRMRAAPDHRGRTNVGAPIEHSLLEPRHRQRGDRHLLSVQIVATARSAES